MRMALAVAATLLACAGEGEPDRPYAYEVEILGWPSDCAASTEGVCIRDAASGRDATCIHVPGREPFFSWSLREPCGPDACTVTAENGSTLSIACPMPL